MSDEVCPVCNEPLVEVCEAPLPPKYATRTFNRIGIMACKNWDCKEYCVHPFIYDPLDDE